ncbi:MAG: MMPL family transporter [Prevotella sp.]|jgi:predicted exporter
MTGLCIRLYHYFQKHRAIHLALMVGLFVFFGFFAARMQLQEDLSALIPESKDADGSTKVEFANLRIKDKTMLLFQGSGKTSAQQLTDACDDFVTRLVKADRTHWLHDAFYQLDEETLEGAIDYLSYHLPNLIDTAMYASMDTLFTLRHMQRQMRQNSKDLDSDFGQAYPDLIQMDPMGLRNVFASQYKKMFSGTGRGGYKIIDRHLFAGDSTVCVAILTPRFSAMDTGGSKAFFDTLGKLKTQFEQQHPNIKVSYNGAPVSGYYNAKSVKHDLMTTLPAGLLIGLLIVAFTLRRGSSILLLIVPEIFGCLFALSMLYFIKGSVSLLALGMTAVVAGVAVSYALHLVAHCKYVDSMEQLLHDEVKPVSMGCITTIGAFAGLLVVRTEVLRDFGLMAILFILGTVAFALTMLPPLMKTATHADSNRANDAVLTRPVSRPKPWMVATSAIIVVLAAMIWLVKGTTFDADLHHLGYQNPEEVASSKLLSDRTSNGDKQKYFAASGKTMEEALNNFTVLHTTLDSLKQLGWVNSYTPTDQILVPLKVQEQRIDAWKRYWTPARKSAAQSLITASAPSAGLQPEAFDTFFETVDEDYTPDALYKADVIPYGYLSTLMENTGNGQWLCFTSVHCDSAQYKNICDRVTKNKNLMVLDTYYYAEDTLKNINHDFNLLQWFSMLFVLLVLLLSYRFRVLKSLIAFTPILLSWVVVMGVMVLTGESFNLINIIISTFIFGMGVDYSIFVMSGLESKDGQLLLRHHKTVILLSAAILMASVSGMLFATHPAIRSVALPTLVGLAAAVVLSFTLEPAMYLKLIKNNDTSDLSKEGGHS